MNLATRKYNFIQEITTMDEALLEKLEMVLKINKKDWFVDLSLEEKQEIEIGLKEADNDELMSHKEVMSQFAKWH
jgi:predicted transcriptional regulator